MKKKTLSAVLAIVCVVFLASTTVSVFADNGDPCTARFCDRDMEISCGSYCMSHGGCDGVQAIDSYCSWGMCMMEYRFYCNDGFYSSGHECNGIDRNCVWF